MAKYRYMNLNPYPVVVPGKGGTGSEFRSGQGSNNAWFSRFCGPKKLTDMGGSRPAAPAAPVQSPSAPPVAPLPNTKLLAQMEDAVESETNMWRVINGIYYCKMCDLFRTGSTVAMMTHLRVTHKVDPEGATLVSGKKAKTAEEAEKQPDAASETVSPDEAPSEAPEAPVVPEAKLQGIPCPYCERRFKNAAGLATHARSKHPGQTLPARE